MQTKEKVKEQRLIITVAHAIFILAFLIPGLDFRFGWTRKFAEGVPLWWKIVSLGLILAGYLMSIWVMDVNRYASRTIQVEAGQRVVSTGPYKLVRHPMYFGLLIMMVFTPLALGSYVSVPFFVLIVPVLVFRLRNEENVLRQELPGYSEYSEGTRYRVIPCIW